MRPFLELIIIAAVILMGWNRPFRDHVHTMLPWADVAPSRFMDGGKILSAQPPARLPGARVQPYPTPQRDNSWMWEPSILDRKTR